MPQCRIPVEALLNNSSSPLAQLAHSAASMPSIPAASAQPWPPSQASFVASTPTIAAPRAPMALPPLSFTPLSTCCSLPSLPPPSSREQQPQQQPYYAPSQPPPAPLLHHHHHHPADFVDVLRLAAAAASTQPAARVPIASAPSPTRQFRFVNGYPSVAGASPQSSSASAVTSPLTSPTTSRPVSPVPDVDGRDDADDTATDIEDAVSMIVVRPSITIDTAEAVRQWWSSQCASKWALPVCPWPDCGVEATQPKQLIAHIVVHLHRDFSRCPFCPYRQDGKKFKLLSHLQRHIAAAHKCRCGATFSQVQALMRHRRELRCPLRTYKPLDKTRSRRRIAIGQLIN